MLLIAMSVTCILLLIALVVTISHRDRLLTRLRTSSTFPPNTSYVHQIETLEIWSLAFVLTLIGLGIAFNIFFYFLD